MSYESTVHEHDTPLLKFPQESREYLLPDQNVLHQWGTGSLQPKQPGFQNGGTIRALQVILVKPD